MLTTRNLRTMVHYQPKLALAYRLTTYFKKFPVDNNLYDYGDAEHAIFQLLLGNEPTTLTEYRESNSYSNYLLPNWETKYVGESICTNCGTIHCDLPVYTHHPVVPVCNCCHTEYTYLHPIARDSFNPMLQLLVKFI